MTAITEEPAMQSRFGVRMLRAFQIDVRALAAMRIALGLTMLFDLLQRARFFKVFYTDWGVAPRALVMTEATGRLSLYALSGSYRWMISVLIVHIILALFFTIGYRTRLATVALLVLVYSLINRNPMLVHGGDNLELWLLFWSIFLPLGAAAAVDARTAMFNWKLRGPRRVYSIASVGILVQVALVYWSAVSAKQDAAWISDFTAVHYFLHAHWATPLGFRLGEISALMQPLTYMTLALELIGPIAALITWDMPRARTIIALIFMSFHLGLSATMYVGTFSFICISGWMLFLPAEFWDVFLRFSPVKMLSSAWRRLIGAFAGIARFAPQRGISALKLHPKVQTALMFFLGYLLLVNFVSDLPPRFRSYVGPLGKVPKLKQSWGVMHSPTLFLYNLQLELQLENGKTIDLNAADPRDPAFRSTLPENTSADDYWNRSIIPAETTPLIEYRTTMLQGAIVAPTPQIKRYCEFHRQVWNESHADPGEKVKEISAYCVYKQVLPVGGDLTHTALVGRQLEYSWPSGASAANPSGHKSESTN